MLNKLHVRTRIMIHTEVITREESSAVAQLQELVSNSISVEPNEKSHDEERAIPAIDDI
jgi:hypothetical protein